MADVASSSFSLSVTSRHPPRGQLVGAAVTSPCLGRVGCGDGLRHHPSHHTLCQPCAPGHGHACSLGSGRPRRLGLECLSRDHTLAAGLHPTAVLCPQGCLGTASSCCAATLELEPGSTGRGRPRAPVPQPGGTRFIPGVGDGGATAGWGICRGHYLMLWINGETAANSGARNPLPPPGMGSVPVTQRPAHPGDKLLAGPQACCGPERLPDHG